MLKYFIVLIGMFLYHSVAIASYFGSWSIYQQDGVQFNQEDIRHLPVGSNTSSLLEYWYLPSLVYNPDLAGFAATEPTIINTHGSSHLWQHFWINGVSNNDVDDPGKAFIDIPLKFVDTFKVKSIITSYANQKGYSWDLKNINRESFVNTTLTTHLGGATFFIPRTFDREPARAWGAPERTRKFHPSPEFSTLFKTHPNNLIFSELIYHERDFLSHDTPEKSFKFSSIYIHQLPKETQLFLAYQGRFREAEGLERNFVFNNTQKGSEHNILLILDFKKKYNWEIQTSFGLGLEFWKDQNQIYSYELSREINFAQTPQLPYNQISLFSEIIFKNEQLFNFKTIHSKLGFYNSTKTSLLFEKSTLSHSFLQRFDGLNSLEVILFDPFKYASNILLKNQMAFYLKTKIKKFQLHTELGVLLEALFHQQSSSLWGVRPNANIKGEVEFGKKFDFLFGIQHEAIPLTMKEARFLNPNSVSGQRQRWNDVNNNNQYDTGEELGILNRTGGKYHQVNSQLELPSIEEIHIAFRYRLKKIFETTLSFTGSLHRNLYWVSFPSDFDHGYTPLDQNGTTIYNRTPGTYGQEIYELTNNPRNAYFGTVELQVLKTKYKSIWFLNFTIGAYLNLANTFPGNTSYLNDIGEYDEATADPNNNINTYGRPDYDRGYMLHFVIGFEIVKDFTWSNIFRYRDGAPLAKFSIARGLNQGPAPYQIVERASGLEGIGRYTYYFTWDMRLRYRYKGFEITFDVYNLLGSSTELIENHFNRDPIEASIPRTLKISLTYYW